MSDALGTVYVEIGAKIDGLTSALNSVQAQLAKTKEDTQKWGDKFTAVGKQMAVTGGAITAALTAIVYATSKAGDEFDEMSEKTGISTEVLSTLKLAADKSGTSIGAVAMGMKFLASQMIETSSAGDKSKTVLGALKISATDLSGKLRPMNDVLFDVADRFKGMEAGALKTKLAVAIFGKAGMDMIPILNLGRKGLEENEAAARKLGIEWSSKSTKAAAAFQDALEDLKAANVGLGKSISTALMPMLDGVVKSMTGAIVKVREWADKNPDLARTLGSLALALGGVMTGLGSTMILIPKIVNGFEGLAKALKISTAALGASVVGLTLLVGAAVIAYNTINSLTKAKDDATEADYRAFESSKKTGVMLRAVADAAGLTRAEFVKLTEKYDGNNAALATAIRRGEVSVPLQQAMAKYGKEHGAAMDTQRESADKLDPSLQAILDSLDKSGKATRTLAEELGLVFNADLQARIDLIKLALEKYKGQLSPESEKKLRDELSKLSDEMATGGLVTAGLAQRYKTDLKPALIEVSKTIINTALPAARKLPQAVYDMIPAGKEMASEWGKVNEQIAADFIRTVGSIITGQSTIREGLSSLGSSLINIWLSALTSMVTAAVAAGTSIGAAFTAMLGPVGLVILAIGAVISVLGALYTSAGEKAAAAFQGNLKRIQKEFQYLGEISDKVAGEIARAMMNGSTQVEAVAKNLTAMMKDTGINAENFAIYLSKATNTLTLMEQGLLNTTEGARLADEQFALLVEAAKKLGTEGSEAMINFIKTSREMGLELASVNAYVIENLNKIPAALTTMIAASDNSATSLAGLGAIALTTFEGMIAAGVPWYQAVQAMSEPLAALAKKYKDLGLEADPALKELMKVIGVTEANKDLFAAIDANATVLKALSNSGYLTAESMKTLTANALGYHAQLIKNGLTEDQALKAMKGSLQDIYDASVANGIPLDENTAKLVEQAKKAGLVKDKVDMGQVATDTLGVLDKIAKMFETWLKSLGLIVGEIGNMGTAIGGLPDLPEIPGDGGGGGGGTCFVAGTSITMADGSKRPIESLAIGDIVRGWDVDKWAPVTGNVSALIVHGPDEVTQTVTINGTITATPEHPFYINGSWRQVGNARIGDHLVSSGGWLVDIFAMERQPGGVAVYNLTLDNTHHDYFAGGVLVHNIEQKPGYAAGGIAWTPQVATLAEHRPEIIGNLDDYLAGRPLAGIPAPGAQGGGGVTINYAPTIQAMDSQDVHRFMSGKGRDAIVGILRSNLRGLAREFAVETSKYGGR